MGLALRSGRVLRTSPLADVWASGKLLKTGCAVLDASVVIIHFDEMSRKKKKKKEEKAREARFSPKNEFPAKPKEGFSSLSFPPFWKLEVPGRSDA